jgi:hypothetical protein
LHSKWLIYKSDSDFLQIPDDPLTIINDKHDKEEFDEMDDDYVRIIGYFEPGSAGTSISFSFFAQF